LLEHRCREAESNKEEHKNREENEENHLGFFIAYAVFFTYKE
jgi:hypothetical protein